MTQDNEQESYRNWAMLCHLSSIVWIPIALFLAIFGLPLPIPFLNILGPLFVWLSKKNRHPSIDAHGKESLNFQISITIYSLIASIVLLFLLAITCGVGFTKNSSSNNQALLLQIGLVIGSAFVVLALVVAISQLFLVIFAAIKAKKGEFYTYPFTLRFLR